MPFRHAHGDGAGQQPRIVPRRLLRKSDRVSDSEGLDRVLRGWTVVPARPCDLRLRGRKSAQLLLQNPGLVRVSDRVGQRPRRLHHVCLCPLVHLPVPRYPTTPTRSSVTLLLSPRFLAHSRPAPRSAACFASRYDCFQYSSCSASACAASTPSGACAGTPAGYYYYCPADNSAGGTPARPAPVSGGGGATGSLTTTAQLAQTVIQGLNAKYDGASRAYGVSQACAIGLVGDGIGAAGADSGDVVLQADTCSTLCGASECPVGNGKKGESGALLGDALSLAAVGKRLDKAAGRRAPPARLLRTHHCVTPRCCRHAAGPLLLTRRHRRWRAAGDDE